MAEPAVRQKRIAADMSQEAVARASGLSVYRILRLENERATIRIEDALALAKVFQCDYHELLPQLAQANLATEEPARA